MKATRRLATFLAPYRLWVILAPLMMTGEVLMDLFQPRLIQRIIDDGIARNDSTIVRNTAILMIALALFGVVTGMLCGVFAIRASQGFGADLRQDLFARVQNLSFGNLDRLETGGLITRLTNDVTQLIEVVALLLRIMVRAPLLLVGSLVMATLTSPNLAFLFLILIPVVIVIVVYFVRRAFPLFSRVQKRLDALNSVLQENLAGVRVVRVFARSNHEINRFRERNRSLMEANLTAMRTVVIVMPLMMLTVNAGVIAALWYGGNLINSGNLRVGELIAFVNYLMQTLGSLMMVSMLMVRVSRAEASAQRVAEVLDSTPDIVPTASHARELTPRRLAGKVEFRHVRFRYRDVAEPALDDVSFVAEQGQVVAILGATGSGKSTLVNLIPRFYDVDAGQVLLDDVDVREIETPTLRQNIAIALQESILFTGSIRDNIAYGRPDASDDEVLHAAKLAQADEFIQRLPDQYEAVVGQRGVNLSGGQKQRLSIARALMMNTPILILDDSTSAVDVATEGRIRAALASIDQTCIIVAQRISAVVRADRILVLDDGRIVAEGTHDELLATSEVYRDIHDSQMERGAVIHGTA